MAEDASPETTPSGRPASGGTSPGSGPAPGGGSPLDDLEDAAHGDDPFAGENPLGEDTPFGAEAFSDEPAALMVSKFWIRQNALLSVGLAFAAGTLIGALKR